MRYVFGDYTLDTRQYELRRAGAPIPLRPKVFHLLAYLLVHRDRIIPRQELCEHLWPKQFVSDSTLDACLGQARQAVGDSGRTQRVIQTRHGYGYRVVAAVEVDDDSPGTDDGRATPPTPQELEGVQPAESAWQRGRGPVLVPGVAREPPLPLTPLRSPLHSILAGERKVVTVLVCTLANATTLAQHPEAEALYQRMQGFFALVMEEVERYGGMLQRVLDDGVLVLFGAPVAHEDHAQRAVLAALALQERLHVSRPQQALPPEELVVRMGLHTGQIVIGSLGDDERLTLTPVGDTTHLAAWLAQQAAPGSILVSDAMAHLVQGVVRLAKVEPVPMLGAPTPDPGYLVLGRHTQRRPLIPRETRILTPFIGRARELATLHALLSQAGEGRGQVVGIIGEPGVGKTRLCYEFSQAHRTRGWLILETSADSYGKATPYLPIIDLLKSYFEITASDDRQNIRDQVSGKLLGLEKALGPSLPAVLALLDVPAEDPAWQVLEPLQRRQRTLQAIKQLVLCASQVQPLLVVVENLHWIDTETQGVLDTLVESLPTACLLLLVPYRPEYNHGWGNKTSYTQLRLDPLPPASAEAMLHSLLGDDAGLEPLKQRLIERTQGNPFFLEESVRTLVETQVLVGAQGAYRLAPNVGAALRGRPQEGNHIGLPLPPEIQVPATVQAVLAARIDRLPAEEKQLLQIAAVIGTEVPLALLQAMTEVPDEPLRLGLTHLQAAEFLYETRLFPGIEYTFKHALTQQVAYETLLQERRRALHARIVEALEVFPVDRVAEQVERLAQHALRGELWDKTLAYCWRAGEKAMARSAHREAVGSFEQALSALRHLPETRDTREQAIDLRLALVSALRPLGDFGRLVAVLCEAESLAEALDNPRRLGQISASLSVHFRQMGAYDQAIAAGERALAHAVTGRDIVLHALANQYLGLAYVRQGNYRRAIDCYRQTVAFSDEAQGREHFGNVIPAAVRSRVALATCHAELGMFAEGKAVGEEGLRIAEAMAHPASLMYASWGIGLLALCQGDLHGALPRLERAMGLCQDADLPIYFHQIAAPLGAAYALAGRVADAVPLLTQAIEQATAMKMVVFQVSCRLSLGEAQMLAGRLEEAHSLAEQALAFSHAYQERGQQAYALRLLGEIAARRDPPESALAESYYRQAVALAEELGMRPLLAHCHLGLGSLYTRIGRPEHAQAEISTAIGLYRAMEMTFWLPQAEAELTQARSSLALPQHRELQQSLG
ncbi:MAG: AAA family ATPase [Candidatus Entotheonellia bacterium]